MHVSEVQNALTLGTQRKYLLWRGRPLVTDSLNEKVRWYKLCNECAKGPWV